MLRKINSNQPQMTTAFRQKEDRQGWLNTVKHHFHIPFFNLGSTSDQLQKALAELYSHARILDASALLSEADAHGRITFANEKFCETSGYSLKELLGKPHNIIRHPDTPAETFRQMWQTILSGKVWQGELKNRKKNGEPYWVIATIAPVLGKDGKPEKFISIRYDITRQKQMEEELRIAKRRSESALIENVNYARRIHNSLLTDVADLRKIFPESFLIYKAQNIVSGDFYRVEKNGNRTMMIIGDSTGHGISASYISVIILNHLSRMLESGSCNPGMILRMVHREVRRVIHAAKDEPVIDTADMLAGCLDHDTLVFSYASARFNAVVVRDGQVIELKKDKCSIGDPGKESLKLSINKLQLQKGDQLYLFSDGMYDQLGGPLNKRYSRKRFLSLLKEHADKNAGDQQEIIRATLEDWQRGNYQTDDMTLLGLAV